MALVMALAMALSFLAPFSFTKQPEAYAAVAPIPDTIKNVSVSPADIVLDNQRGQTSILIGHDTPTPNPLTNAGLITQSPPGEYSGRTVKYYVDAYNKGYRGKAPVATYEDTRGVDWGTDKFKIDGLLSGTVYDIEATTYTRYYDILASGFSPSRNSPESARSDKFRLYTGTQLNAALVAPDQVRLSWDDVWYNDQRIYAYDLNIYTNKSSTTPERTMRFTGNLIGPGQPVTINETAGKLEFTYNVPYPGRVYCFEIVPVMSNVPNVVVPLANARVTVATTILVSAVKLYESDSTITWQIRWSNVTAGMGAVSGSKYTAEYMLYQLGASGSMYTLLQRIDNETSTIIETQKDNPLDPSSPNTLYEIAAIVYEDGREMYIGDNIYITSGPFSLREGETAYKPQAPVLYSDESKLTETGAGLWWSIPKQVTDPDLDDENIDYEIYVLTDPEQLNNLTAAPTYTASGRTLGKGVYNGKMGYIYQIPNLQANTTYYLSVRAVKTFMDLESMTNIRIASELSYVAVTTPPILPIGQPPAPTTLDIYKDRIRYNSVTLRLKTAWYESFDESSGEWTPCDRKYAPDGLPIPEGPLYRKLSYEPGDKITVYYTPFTEEIDLNDPDGIAYKYTTSTKTFNITRFDDEVWMDLLIDGLKPNETYIFWAKADRNTTLSFPSKTIVATTPPFPTEEIGKPTVPDFDFVFIGDTYVDLTWIKEEAYTYHIQVSLSDNAGQGSGQGHIYSVTTEQIYESGVDFYRITGLSPDTMYYFRIQAQVKSPVSGEIKTSEWSDYKPAKTRPPIPPGTPSGFGIKAGVNSITKNSIFYEWMLVPGLSYILEYSEDATMASFETISAGAVSEYNLTGLLSNHRYHARLYAYDPITGLRSEPTHIISVRTRRSDDDYDSNVDNTTQLTGEFIEKAAYSENGIWTVKITGTNADRFVERVMTDNMLDYVVDLSSPPRYTKVICLIVDNIVFDSLAKMLENIEVKLSDKTFVIRPRMLSAARAGGVANRKARFQFEVMLGLEGNEEYEAPGTYRLKTTVTSFEVNVLDGSAKLPVESFGKPLKVVVPFTSASYYTDGETFGITSAKEGVWERHVPAADFNSDTRRGTVTFEHSAPGNYALADVSGSGITDLGGNKLRSYINRLARAGLLDVPPGGKFRADDPVTPDDAVSMLYKAFGYKTTGSNMDSAYKAGFVTDPDLDDMLIEEAVAMVIRAYEVRTGIKANPNPDPGDLSPGVKDVDAVLRGRVQFAIDNGLLEPIVPAGGTFPTGSIATRGEMATLLAMTMIYLGVI